MTPKQMDKFTNHIDKFFEQKDLYVLHPLIVNKMHIDVLVYEPTKKFPFWKLVTMGASDYKMPAIKGSSLGHHNEYMMFIDGVENLNDRETIAWYYEKLMLIATYPYETKSHVTYAHSMEWENDDPNDEMVGAFIEMPQIIEDVGILRCKMGLSKKITCLQVVLLNRQEINHLLKIGPQAFSNYLYPENGDRGHFLSERHRSSKF